MLAARGLRKANIPASLIQDPSPGSLQPTRLALHVNGNGCGTSCSVYVASGCRVYRFEISTEGACPAEGKDSLIVPVQTQIMQSHAVDRCPHHSEIQSIALAEGDSDSCLMLGTVDCYGQLIVSGLDATDADINRRSYSISPRGYGVGEGSWAGVCFSPSNSSTVAIVHSFCKSIDIYDQDIHLQSFQTLWYPNSSTFLQGSLLGCGSSVLAVAEGSQLTIWDLRTGGGCVQRVCGSVGDLIYAISCSPSGHVAVGGSDRCLTIYDPRRWSALARWASCSKYEITGLSFSSLNSDYMYVQGVDYEVFCGQWRENKKVFSFRGDSNWLGFSKDSKRDVLAGWCDSGSIFVADAVAAKQLEIW
ncbi:unnamed protein product [Spirodela intermedia]|uniref:Uncharacterized protein n=2 Tax=Spirodela intermedia TaxID=51605 RepID=A0A7I8IU93_SPIIN|nr:unnamed protein product [Spirodela intermedia]CAA6660537.1 unnamed protein product [Spirodela intermedia]CAA7396888.1 unnamed protein product [Spirodela intermedia]